MYVTSLEELNDTYDKVFPSLTTKSYEMALYYITTYPIILSISSISNLGYRPTDEIQITSACINRSVQLFGVFWRWRREVECLDSDGQTVAGDTIGPERTG